MKNGKTTIGKLQILAAFTLAGSSVPVGKLLVGNLPPFSLALLSLASAFVFLLPALIADRRAIAGTRRKDILLICLQALFGMALFRIFMLSGLSLTSGSHAGVITAFGPLVMGAASVIFLREKPSPALIAGMGLGTAGIVLLRIADFRGDSGASSLWGDLLVFAAICCEAAMSLIRKKSGAPLKPLTTAGIIVGASIVYVLPLAAGEWVFGGIPRLTPRDAWGILYYGAAATALAYYFWAAGSSKVSGNTIALAMIAMPLCAVGISMAFLGESPEILVLAGLVLGLAGMALGQAKSSNMSGER